MRKKRLKNKKHFSFYLFVHSSLMIVYILLKDFKVYWKTPHIGEPTAPNENYQLALQVN